MIEATRVTFHFVSRCCQIGAKANRLGFGILSNQQSKTEKIMKFKTLAFIMAALSAPGLVRAEGPDNRFGSQPRLPAEAVQQPSQPTASLQNTTHDFDVYTFEWLTVYRMVIHWQNGTTTTQTFSTADGYDQFALFLYRSNTELSYLEEKLSMTVKGNFELVDRFDTYSEASLVVAALSNQGKHAEIRSVLISETSTFQQSPTSRNGRRRQR